VERKKPYIELPAPPASKARKRKVKAARKKRAAGEVGAPVNVPRLQPKRPGGKLTKLTDSATAKRRFAVKGRRGVGYRHCTGVAQEQTLLGDRQ